MNNKFIEARGLLVKAREALRRGDQTSARQLGEQAALRTPELEDVWLVLAASDPNPQDALAYARKALELKPESTRARRGVEWASGRLKQVPAANAPAAIEEPSQNKAVTSLPKKRSYQTAITMPELKSNGRNWLYPLLLIAAGCMVVGFMAFFALTHPALASIVSRVSAPAATQENLWAPVDIAKPGLTPIAESAFAQPLVEAPASTSVATLPALSASPAPTTAPTDIPTEAPTVTPEATETPGTMAMEILADTPTSEYIAPSLPSKPSITVGKGVRWIDVDLTNQRVYAYEGDTIVNSFIVSTGTSRTPTVTGKFKVYIRLRSGSMRGPGYFLPDVPYIMYFHKSYGLHGTYWHNNFGTPMSHGCVNLSIADAAWLYNWSYMGTVVNVHY